ncbi:MAG: hypothetical protein JKY33_03975, partial [Bacteroidia bacterium]|nr:hypothetical protein [Bacteroidia bacterium]
MGTKKTSPNPLITHAMIIAGFLVITLTYFSPILQGKRIVPLDNKQNYAASKELRDYHEKFGRYPLWTNSVCSGLPSYLICMEYYYNIGSYVIKFFQNTFPQPVCYVLLYLLGFYILFSCMKIEPLLCCIGAVALTFCSYNFIILEAGHNTKAMAIAFMGPVIGGIFLILRSKYLLGWLLTAIGVALEIRAKHLQVTYYFFFFILIILLTEAYFAFKEKRHQQFLKGVAIMAFAAIVGLGTNTSFLWTTSEYVPYTIRGKKELTEAIKKDNEIEGIG